ncbi:MAG TPA: endonuclease/exonuclease/phosphatase family protein [Anaerolineae bacterium]|jgi:endonuclease/exonuclease/phosphatase family metal-dependent hydrolase|nr:endonuclease/exonuclease/phosphatase family protein [Anaerolineae bacterium]
MEVKVATWNIRHGLGMDNQQDLQRVLEVLADINPGIAILNEVDRYVARSGFIDQAKWLAGHLSMNYYFSPSFGIGPVGFGNAILSRGAFIQTSYSRLSYSWEPRKALVTDIDVHGVRVTCVGVHLNVARTPRVAENEKLLGIIQALTGEKVVLAGDFNSEPDTDEIKALSRILIDAFSNNPKPTFPADNPRKRIDYLFISSGCSIIDSGVPSVKGSDHLPLYAVIDV